MTVDAEPRRSRRGLLAAVLGVVIAAVAATVAGAVAATVSLRKQDGTRITMSITIDRPVAEVFAFVSDARNVLEWLPAAVERRKVTDGPVGVGTRLEATDRFGQRTVSHSQEIIDFDQDRLVSSQISAPWAGTYEIRVEPAEGGTLLTVNTIVRASGLYRLMGLVPKSVIRQQFEADYARLKDLLEGQEQPAADDDGTAAKAEPVKTPVTIAIEPEGESRGPVPKETWAT